MARIYIIEALLKFFVSINSPSNPTGTSQKEAFDEKGERAFHASPE